MPIKFRCEHCRQFLGISHTKSGSLVDCPTCGRTIRVPDPEGFVQPMPELKLNLKDIPYVLQYNQRDLPNVAPVEYMEFLLNNREVQVPSFTGAAHKCEGVFETLNMITRMLLNKFIAQGSPQYA